MEVRRRGPNPHDFAGHSATDRDPLKRYPRMAQMHRWDEASLQWMIDPRIDRVMTALLGRSPYAVQTMIYFKPPGSRGQALHQDNFYLKADPGTCVAAWMALDRVDRANGCLEVVPGSHRWPILCTEKADTTVSFTDITVPLPEPDAAVPVEMEPGDVLFFHGALVHGSAPNITTDRFRRALIGHYIQGEAEQGGAVLPPGAADGRHRAGTRRRRGRRRLRRVDRHPGRPGRPPDRHPNHHPQARVDPTPSTGTPPYPVDGAR